MKRKNKLKWLTMSVVALGAISVVPIITTSCSSDKDPSEKEISEAQYQEQADTIANINAAIEEIENGTYSRTLSEVVDEIKSYEYFDVVINIEIDMYDDDRSYNDSYLSWLTTTIYEPFENKNILLSYDQFCILIDSDYQTSWSEYWEEENTLEENYYAHWIQTNINLIAFLDNTENLLLLPYFDEDWRRIEGFVENSVFWVYYFSYCRPDESWNFTNYFSNYYELAEKLGLWL